MAVAENGPASNLRSRTGQKSEQIDEYDPLDSPKIHSRHGKILSKKAAHSDLLGFRHWLLVFVYIFVVYLGVMWLDARVPAPVPAGQFVQFSEERARTFLEELTAFGPRPSGSHALEVLATELIIEELETISKGMLSVHRMDIEVQRPSDCFDMDFLSDFTLCYKNVTNIVARFGPKSQSPAAKHSLLISCHYDSVPDSPGATDDGVSCSIMLEVLRILSHQESPLENDLIFLFNGAEENFLQAAHGFITQHPWRHSIRGFVNLEGAGAGGRELLFQAGPGNGWLLEAYLKAAPHPHCSILGQEMFQNGFVPSDTDFRIYRDYGLISGLDIAYVKNGYLYHTEFDTVEYINSGAIQRTGENVLETVRALVNCPYLAHPGDYHGGRYVYLDIAGLFMIFYPQYVGSILNYLTVLAVIVKIGRNLLSEQNKDRSPAFSRNLSESSYTVQDFLVAVVAHAVVSATIMGSLLGMAQLVNAITLTLVWYAQPSYLIPMYLVPGLMVGFAMHGYLAPRILKRKDPMVIERANFDATICIFAALLFLMSWMDLGSAFFVLIHVLAPLLREACKFVAEKVFGFNERNPRMLLGCHMVSLFPIVFMGSYVVLMTLEIFVPMLGRTGTKANPEIFVAIIIGLVAISFTLYSSSLILVSRKLWYILQMTFTLSGLCFVLLLTTNLGVPYRWSKTAPRLRRVHLGHVARQVYAENDTLIQKDFGLWVASFDYRGSDDLPAHTFLQGSKFPSCDEDPYCNLPYYVPVDNMIPPQATKWVSLPNPPPLLQPLKIELLSKAPLADGQVNLTISIDGPDHISAYLTPKDAYDIEQWSFTGRREHYKRSSFVYLAYAKYHGPWVFWVVLKPNSNATTLDLAGKQLRLGVGSHVLHGDNQKSETLSQIVKLIKERRADRSDLAVGWWRWAITPQAWNNEFVSKFF